jgi:hypothetical protein
MINSVSTGQYKAKANDCKNNTRFPFGTKIHCSIGRAKPWKRAVIGSMTGSKARLPATVVHAYPHHV